MKKRLVFGIPPLVIGLLIAIGPQTLFPVCEVMGEMVMHCHWTAQAELGIGLVIALLGLAGIIFSSKDLRLGLSISLFLNGLLALLVPSVLIGVCPGAHMPCHILTLPALSVLSALLVVISVINGIVLFKDRKVEGK
jgi:glucose uptake protein GlcU